MTPDPAQPDGSEPPDVDALFEALPPLGSPAYLSLVRKATKTQLPARVLVRAYRQLLDAGDKAGARATLERLVGGDPRPEYLGFLLDYAYRRVPRNQYWQDPMDLYHDAVIEIVEVLGTPKGAFAERSWRGFCKQRFEDAYRARQGRRGEREEPQRVEPSVRPDREGIYDPLEDASTECIPPWHGRVGPDKLPWLEQFVRRTLARIEDPVTREIAFDQWLSDNRSQISGGRSGSGKPPLTEQYNLSRFQVMRHLDRARARVKAALLTQRKETLDIDWL